MQFTVTLPGNMLYADGHSYQEWESAVTSHEIVRMAQAADTLGYHSVSLPTHFLMNHRMAKSMGPRWTHSLSMAGFVLGATERIKVACLVIVPNHHPIELAKALATLDWASGGRLIVVPLVGHQAWEYAALGIPYADRGPMMDEYMDAMIELWTSDNPTFEGKYVTFNDVVFDPRPYQEPLPLWFGGRTKIALRRLARLGHGWYSSTTPHLEFPRLLEYIRTQPTFAAAPRPLEVYAAIGERKLMNFETHEFAPPPVYRTPDEILEQCRFLSSMGITLTRPALEGGSPAGDLATSVDDYIRRLEWFASEVMPDAVAL